MKKNKRKLQLNRLTIVQLTTRELVKVKGGGQHTEGGDGGGGDDPLRELAKSSLCNTTGGGWAASYDYC